MSKFRTKKFILTSLIFIILTTFSFAMLQVFRNENAQSLNVYAFTYDGNNVSFENYAKINSIDTDGWSHSNGVFTANVPRKHSITGQSKSFKVTITLTEKSKVSINVVVTSGGLTCSSSDVSTTGGTILVLEPGSYTYTFTSSSYGLLSGNVNGVATVSFLSIDSMREGLDDNITQGMGIPESPYIIDSKEDFASISKALNAAYKISDDVEGFDFSDGFTPIGSTSQPFTGSFDGNNKLIKNVNIAPRENYGGFFSAAFGATISNLNIENITMRSSANNSFSASGFVAGSATGKTIINNVVVSGVLYTNGAKVGGLVGFTDQEDGVICSNCKVYGQIRGLYGNVGGFSGVGGTFTNCEMYADVIGNTVVGGFVGGYQVDSTFTDCLMAGTVQQVGDHKNNYPYFAVLTGYGAWSTYNLIRSGQYIDFSYTTEQSVEAIDIFNSNLSPEGISVEVPEIKDGKYNFKQLVAIDKTNADTSYQNDEYNTYGILGNYGGFTIRFTMADGTYKYISTLDKSENKFVSTFSISLEDLTSYENNFSSIVIDRTKGTDSFSNNNNIAMWGAAEISNANDFEHLSWVINGAIPTTFSNGIYYNARTIATISVKLTSDIDLTEVRAGDLNKNAKGEILYQFYGFGKNEMLPYRGNIYGEGHSLNVKMEFENAYALGIICTVTDDKRTTLVENLTVSGSIKGGYRVGIIGMNDNYSRQCSVKFEKVTNNANMTAKSLVGAFLGMAQGGGKLINYNAKIIFNDCVNNGNITATAGCAGGFMGSGAHLKDKEKYCTVTLNNSTNNGKVQATTYAGGFVGMLSSNPTLQGINTNAGIVVGSTANYYISSAATVSFSSSANLRTMFKININMPSTQVAVTSTGANIYNTSNEVCTSATFTSDSLGIVYVPIAHAQTFNGISLTIINDLLIKASEIVPTNANSDNVYSDEDTITNYKKTMATFVVLPKTITLKDSSVYTTNSSSEKWNIVADIELNNSTTISDVVLIINLSEDVLKTNQLIFNGVSLSYDKYKFPTVTLQRITTQIENYVELSTTLKAKESGTTAEFTKWGTDALFAYEEIYNDLSVVGFENDLVRFNNYISSHNVSKQTMDSYYSKIVKTNGINTSALQNYEINYGNYSFSVQIQFTMLVGEPINRTLTYDFTKADINKETLKATAKTAGTSFDVNGITTCEFSEDATITVKQIEILLITFPQSVEKTYNGKKQEIDAVEFELLSGDEIESYELRYNGKENAIDAGTYEVELFAISGKDAVFYKIRSEYEKGTLKINELKYSLIVSNDDTLVYNKNPQSYEFELKQVTNNYQIQPEDYEVLYTGTTAGNEAYSNTTKPTDAGDYIATITMLNNSLVFASSQANSFAFTIEKKFVESISCDESLEYNAKAPQFTFVFDDSLDLDPTKFEYEIYDSNGIESEGINVGEYTLHILSLGSSNHRFNSLISTFDITKAQVEIELKQQSETYGEIISLNNLEFEVKSGKVYSPIDGSELNENSQIQSVLGLTLSTTATNNSVVDGDYVITGNSNNLNYSVNISSAKFVISKRNLTINYAPTKFDYSATNQLNKIVPMVEGLLEKDKASLAFTLNGVLLEEQTFKNVGIYVLSVVDHETLNNYTINKMSETYEIVATTLTIKAVTYTAAYKQAITTNDFSVEFVGLISPDRSEDVCEISYKILKDGTEVGLLNLEYGTYTIQPVINKKAVADNYNIVIETAELFISLRSTYLSFNKIDSQIYNGEIIIFTAKLLDDNQTEIENSHVEITITRDGETTETIKDAGKYVIDIFGSASSSDETAAQQLKFDIYKNQVTVSNVKGKTYDARAYSPQFDKSLTREVTNFDNIFNCRVLNLNKETTQAINVGDYFLEFYIDDESKDNFIVPEPIAFKILAVEMSITLDNQSICYGDSFDMSELTYSTDENMLLEGESLDLTYSIEHYTGIVGDYVLTAANLNTNYSVSVTNGTFSVHKRQLTLVYEGKDNLVFNENGQTELLTANVTNILNAEDVSIYYIDSNNKKVEIVNNAGYYELVVIINDTHNFKFSHTDSTKLTRSINIAKKELSLTINVEGKSYDGEPLKLTNVLVEGKVLAENLYTIEFFGGAKLPTAPKNAGDYDVVIKETEAASNYIFINNTKSISISLREVEIKEISKTFEYKRTAIQPKLELENLVANEDVTLNYEYLTSPGNFKEVGEYTIRIIGIQGLDASNYTLIAEDEIKYTIVATNINVTIENKNFTFTNNQITKQELGIDFLGELRIIETDYSLSALPTNAGDYTISFVSLNSGIIFDVKEFNLHIEKATIEGINLLPKTVTYNNQEHSIYVDKTTLNNGIEIDVVYSNNGRVNAGQYIVVATLTNENYITKELTATLTIEQARTTVPVSQQLEFTYNATQQGIEIVGADQLWYNNLVTSRYIGKNYSSISKPTNAGEYSLEITAINANNIAIINSSNVFEIKTKAITIQSLQPQTFTYSSTPQQFKVEKIGVFTDGVVEVKVNYNNSENPPINVGEYEVSFAGLVGKDASNYHIENSSVKTKLIINPYAITVNANPIEAVYGEAEKTLSYTSTNLLGDDVFTGNLIRESGTKVNSYWINQGTLTAGDNYIITFVKAIYNVIPRTLSYDDFQTEFVYNGNAQVPNVKFGNILLADQNVATIKTEGDLINAGTYTLKFVLRNPNYQLPETSIFNITITPKEASEKIIGLTINQADFNNENHIPTAEILGSLDYSLSYYLGGEQVENMLNAGTYDICVELIDRNYIGSKNFTYTINKIDHDQTALSNVEINISSNKFIGNNEISINNQTFDFEIANLSSKTTYDVWVKFEEDQNHKTTVLYYGELSTCASAIMLNEQIDNILNQNVGANNIEDIKELLKDYYALSGSEKTLLNDESFVEMLARYEEYFEDINKEIEDVKISSNIIDLGGGVRILYATTLIGLSGAVMGLFTKKRRKDETHN